MVERAQLNDFPILESISQKREDLGLVEIDIDLLRAQSGSEDPPTAIHAQRVLKQKWDLNPEFDTNNAETVDINQILSQFSENEQKILFENMVGVQLTEGCNGACPFCLFGSKKGVDAKFSFKSLKTFFTENTELISGHPFVLYWDSDPFDYKDGENSFVDVYKLYHQADPHNDHFISTAIPRGGEDNFITFMTYLAIEQKKSTKDLIAPVRISITEQNIQRVEATMMRLIYRLRQMNFADSEIHSLITNNIEIVNRFDDFLLPIGNSINQADEIKDTYSTACRDGVILSPRGAEAIMFTAATIYEPSGQKNIPLIPGKADGQIPKKVRDEQYAIWRSRSVNLDERIIQKRTITPIIKHENDQPYSLSDPIDDFTLKLGREVATYNRLVSNFSKVSWLGEQSSSTYGVESKFLQVSAQHFRERQMYTEKLVNSAECFAQKKHLSSDKESQIKYYILLTKVYLAKMDFLANQVELGQSSITISNMAYLLARVGKDTIDQLPELLDKLATREVSDVIKQNPLNEQAAINLFQLIRNL